MKQYMRKTLALWLAVALLVGAVGCSSNQQPDPKAQSSSEAAGTGTAKPPDSQSTVAGAPAPSTVPAPESKPQELYDGGQEDPTIAGSPQARWEHIEYKNFGSPDSWKTVQFNARQYEQGAEIGDPLVLSFKLPERVIVDGTLDYDGDFAQGNIKIGDGFSSFIPLPPGETAAHNTIQDYSMEHFSMHPLTGEVYTMTETGENQVGGYCYGSRGNVSFARYIGSLSSDNIMLQYVVQLGDRYLTDAYFYVSANATAEDLKIYDEIVLSAH